MSAKGRGAKTDPLDRYYTPRQYVEQFFDLVLPMYRTRDEVATFYDPCAGAGVFGSVARDRLPGLKTREIDIDPSGDGILKKNYLRAPTLRGRVDLIATNPPYRLAEKFIRKARRDAWIVALLLRLNWAGSIGRYKSLFSEPENRPTEIFVLPRRPSFVGRGSDATEYAWFVWDELQDDDVETIIRWLPPV